MCRRYMRGQTDACMFMLDEENEKSERIQWIKSRKTQRNLRVKFNMEKTNKRSKTRLYVNASWSVQQDRSKTMDRNEKNTRESYIFVERKDCLHRSGSENLRLFKGYCEGTGKKHKEREKQSKEIESWEE